MRAHGRRSSAWLALALLGASPAPRAHAAPDPLPPRPTQYATDRAQVFPPARLAALNEKLAAFERVTSNQVLVYLDRSLPPGTSLEEMGATAIREWGLGQKGKSNGVILFVFTGDRALRLEVGYGLEGVLPDARARQITSDVVKPFFKKGDYPGGIEAGVEAILAAARGEAFQGMGRTAAEGPRERGASGYLPALAGLVALGLSGLCGLVFRRRKNPGSYVLFPLVAFGLAFVGGAAIAQQMPWAWAGLFLFLAALVTLLSTHASGMAGASSASGVSSACSSSSWDSSSSSSASSSSSDSSSSDFSGGGGDGGGGGSSDSW
jgi:uncharacterized protein